MSSINNPVQNFHDTIKTFHKKARSKDDIQYLDRVKEVYKLVKNIDLDDVTSRMIDLTCSDLRSRLKHLL